MIKHKNLRNNKGNKHGLWIVSFCVTFKAYTCFYDNDKKIGYEEWYVRDNNKIFEKIYHV
jgi:hypothetical protein